MLKCKERERERVHCWSRASRAKAACSYFKILLPFVILRAEALSLHNEPMARSEEANVWLQYIAQDCRQAGKTAWVRARFFKTMILNQAPDISCLIALFEVRFYLFHSWSGLSQRPRRQLAAWNWFIVVVLLFWGLRPPRWCIPDQWMLYSSGTPARVTVATTVPVCQAGDENFGLTRSAIQIELVFRKRESKMFKRWSKLIRRFLIAVCVELSRNSQTDAVRTRDLSRARDQVAGQHSEGQTSMLKETEFVEERWWGYARRR